LAKAQLQSVTNFRILVSQRSAPSYVFEDIKHNRGCTVIRRDNDITSPVDV